MFVRFCHPSVYSYGACESPVQRSSSRYAYFVRYRHSIQLMTEMSWNFKGKFTDALFQVRTVLDKYINSLLATNFVFDSTSLRDAPSEGNNGKKLVQLRWPIQANHWLNWCSKRNCLRHTVRVLPFNQRRTGLLCLYTAIAFTAS
jgi:hypothetical protein